MPDRFALSARGVALQILTSLACVAAEPALAEPVSVAAIAETAPVPDWVTPVAVEPREVPAGDGVEELLWDTQTWVSNGRVVRFRHGARRPVSTGGLGAASAVGIVFDSTYQSHVWHMLRIVRGDAVIDALSTAEIQRSTGAADQGDMVQARTRVTAFLHDVRVGDIVEYAYSVEGDQPALGGRFAARLELAGDPGVAVIQHRVLWPSGRTLHVRAHGGAAAPERVLEGDRDVYTWQLRDARARPVDPHAPPWFDANPWVQLSEFASWSDVVMWALPMYRSEEMVTPELERLAESFRGGSPADAAARATRFVQDEVRYLGFEFGEGSLRPRAPDLVAARRFGDCKDKSLLLLTLLRLLGVEAVPVLVSTYDGGAVQDRLPSPYDFDHVIVRATLDGRPIWIDSTASYERGPLAARPSPPFGMALPIADGVTAPEPIAAASGLEPGTRVREVFELADTEGRAELHVSTLYRGADANRRRAELATADRGALQKQSLELYTAMYGRMRAARAFEVRDDEQRNELEVQESYVIDELWEQGAAVQLWSIASQAVRTDESRTSRRAPLALAHPQHLVHEIDVLLPFEIAAPETDVQTSAPGIEAHYRVRYSGRHLHLRQDYRTLATHVDVEDLGEYSAALERIDAASSYWIQEPDGGLPGLSGLRSPAVLAALLVLGGYVGWASVRDGRARQRRRRFEHSAESDAGEAPDRPLVGRSLEALERHVSGLSCGCPDPSMSPEREPARLLYMDREIWQQSARCATCRVRLTRYFILDPDAPAEEETASVGAPS